MNNSAFTLVELITVIAIMAIIGSIATLDFHKYNTKAMVEGQTKELFTDIMFARTQALSKQQALNVVITANQYQIVDSTTNAVLSTKAIKYGVTWPGGGTSKIINFDERGLFDVVNNGNTAICVNGSVGDSAIYNSVVVLSTRVQLGKLNSGGCTSANISVK